MFNYENFLNKNKNKQMLLVNTLLMLKFFVVII